MCRTQSRLNRELAKVGTIALDGINVKANATRHKAMSHERIKEKEKRVREEVARLLAEAEATDADEDAGSGPDHSGEGLPEESARRKSRLAKIRQANTELAYRWSCAVQQMTFVSSSARRSDDTDVD
jgi:hypothetical protein